MGKQRLLRPTAMFMYIRSFSQESWSITESLNQTIMGLIDEKVLTSDIMSWKMGVSTMNGSVRLPSTVTLMKIQMQAIA